MVRSVLYPVLYCTELYPVLYCTVLYCTVSCTAWSGLAMPQWPTLGSRPRMAALVAASKSQVGSV